MARISRDYRIKGDDFRNSRWEILESRFKNFLIYSCGDYLNYLFSILNKKDSGHLAHLAAFELPWINEIILKHVSVHAWINLSRLYSDLYFDNRDTFDNTRKEFFGF